MNFRIVILIVLSGAFFSCKKAITDTEFYWGSQVFFAAQNKSDQFFYSFANNITAEHRDFQLPLKIMGDIRPEDRLVKVEANISESTALPDEYELGDAVIPAGSATGYVPVRLVNSARLSSDTATLVLDLKPSSDFNVGPHRPGMTEEIIQLHVAWTNTLVKPSDWPSTWGAYSRTKHKLVIDLTGRIIYSGADWDNSVLYSILGICNDWLNNYSVTNGHSYVNENGNAIWFCSTCM